MQYKFKHFSHVDVPGIRRSIGSSPARSRLDASYDGPVSGLFHGASFSKRHLHRCIVIEKSRICLTFLNHLTTFAEQSLRRALPGAHCHNRLRRLQLICCFQTQIGQIIGGIFAIRCLTTHYKNFPHRITCKGCRIPFISDFVYFTCF